eukprot:7097853-Pyramimonas_sp.AAC.1
MQRKFDCRHAQDGHETITHLTRERSAQANLGCLAAALLPPAHFLSILVHVISPHRNPCGVREYERLASALRPDAPTPRPIAEEGA